MTYPAWGLGAGRGHRISGPLRASESISDGGGMLLEYGRMGGRWAGNPIAGVLLALCTSAFVLESHGTRHWWR